MHSSRHVRISVTYAATNAHAPPEQAACEVAEVENVARGALSEVREAVSGYRQPTLEDELAGARMALAAAGIAAEIDRPAVSLDPSAEAVLAWAMREGATNVIRHSRASCCLMKISAGLGDTLLEVVDERRRGSVAARQNRSWAGRPGRACRDRPRQGRSERPPRGWVQAGGKRSRRVAVIRVLIAEDQAMIRGAVASLLGLEPDIEVVAQVSRGDEVVAAALTADADVALLDIEMPGRTGLEAAVELRRALPGCRILILTTFGRPGYLRRAMERGAAGFLLKDAPASELSSAIRRAVAGERVVDPGLAALSQGESPLTPREHEVLAAARAHATVAELATVLCLSPGTVCNHLSSVMQKLDARNRAEAIRVEVCLSQSHRSGSESVHIGGAPAVGFGFL